MGRIYKAFCLPPRDRLIVDASIRKHAYSNIEAIKDELQQQGIAYARSSLHRYIGFLKAEDTPRAAAHEDTVVMIVERSSGRTTVVTTSATAEEVSTEIDRLTSTT